VMTFNKEKILILAPHTDDGELGCGGTIARFIEEGSEVHYAAFSSCGASVPEGFSEDVLIKEVQAATKLLGIASDNLHIFDFPVRRFAHYRQEILEELVHFQKDMNPDLVFMPSINDLHQDHHIVAMEGTRAFKQTTILAYEMPWNNISFLTQAFIEFDDLALQKKIEALSQYQSQMGRAYANAEFIRSLATIRGVSAGTKYAETFEVVRFIL